MAYFLFIDESGQDLREAPYEVLAGVTVEDRDLWNLVKVLQDVELRVFGTRYRANERELKGKKLLKTKTYRQATALPPIPEQARQVLAKKCLEEGEKAGKYEITALAQAKLAYVQEVLEVCARFRCKTIASIVNRDSPRPKPTHLRKDYAYLFERFYYFLEDTSPLQAGIVVFDELDKSRSHILIDQMARYFQYTTKGHLYSSRIIPEPLFVHSDLTTGIQIADLVAYILSWGTWLPGKNEPARRELEVLTEQVYRLRHRSVREVAGNPNYPIWSFAIISDLRPRDEQKGE